MEPLELRAGGLLLRAWQAEDADAVFRACQDPLIQRWTSVPAPYLREHAEQFVTSYTRTRWADGSKAPLGVFDATTGELLGSNGLVDIDASAQTAEVGFWVAPWARNRGVATDATRAVARWALDLLGVRRLAWEALVGNHASRLVAARLGFRFEGVARASIVHRGERHDAWTGALLTGELRESFRASAAAAGQEAVDDDPALARAVARCRAFGAPQPTLQALAPDGMPVRLRPLRMADVPGCVRACHDPATIRYTTVPHPYDETHAESFINDVAPTAWARGTEAIFAIAGPDDEFAGTMALRLPGDELSTPIGDVGYFVAPWARGRGYASTALRALTDWGFSALALHRIEWRAYVGNSASRATAERAGFRVEGEHRQALTHRGEYEDTWVGARLATDQL